MGFGTAGKKKTETEIEKNGYKGFGIGDKEYFTFTKLPLYASAFYSLSGRQKIVFVSLAIILITSLIISFKNTLIILIAFITYIYFFDLLFNLFIIIKSLKSPPEMNIGSSELENLTDDKLPVYTILSPLYKEWSVLSQFINGIRQLDYPKEKLQVLLLLEEDDDKTIREAENLSLPSYISVVKVPHSDPRTKPKALNCGLMLSRGEYVVVFDAEDVPEKSQLKKALIAFSKEDEQVECVQAKLNFYNTHQNTLTRLFTAEYSLWFDLVLTGLQSINAPIPLGGTSNHFRRKFLQRLYGWDAFNVTEDADLGIRISKNGYRTAIISSTTFEEANSSVSNWFFQRSRWIKGYIQTYLVHTREEKMQWSNSWHKVIFQLIIGGKVASLLINPFMWILTIIYFSFKPVFGSHIEEFFPAGVFYLGIFSLLIGNFLYLYYYMIGCAKRGYFSVIKYAFLVPLYWLGMSIACYFALFKLVISPHHWSKTIHGLHFKESEKLQAYSYR